MLHWIKSLFASAASLIARSGMFEVFKAPRATYLIECRAPDGTLRWAETFHNVVTTAGLNDLLDKYFKGSTYTATWFVGLISATSYTTGPAAGDTMASHGGWTEGTPYSNANRPTLTLGTPSGGSVDNSASKASFTINATLTVKGAFVVTNNTKGGATGTLYSAGLFSGGDRAVLSGDTLDVTVTLSAS